MRNGRGWGLWAVACGAAFTLVGGCGGAGGGNSAYTLSVKRLKVLNRGLMAYMSDNDNLLPPGATWMDALGPYVTEPDNFRSPAVQDRGYGYALNSAIQGRAGAEFPDLSTTLSIFDSTDLRRNATSPASSMPIPPRYVVHNTIAYLDGHVQDDPEDDGSTVDDYQTSRSRLRSCTLGIALYASDNDDRFPLENTWMDRLVPYHIPESSFHSPLVERYSASDFGYAFNIELAGVASSSLPSPATTTMLFDSTLLSRNATANLSTMPNPGRYNGVNTIAHADSSVP